MLRDLGVINCNNAYSRTYIVCLLACSWHKQSSYWDQPCGAGGREGVDRYAQHCPLTQNATKGTKVGLKWYICLIFLKNRGRNKIWFFLFGEIQGSKLPMFPWDQKKGVETAEHTYHPAFFHLLIWAQLVFYTSLMALLIRSVGGL